MSKKEPAKETAKKPEKESVAKKPGRAASPSVKLPILVEAVYTVPPLVILTADIFVIALSYTSGADWVAILVRPFVTTLVLGALMLLLASLVSSGALKSARETRQKAEEQSEKNNSKSIEA